MLPHNLLPYECPVLKSMNITPDSVYEIIFAGVQSIRLEQNIQKSLSNDIEAFKLSSIVEDGEIILSFMRSNKLASQISNVAS